MAGDADEAHMCVLLFFITVFMRLVFIRRRNRFQQRLRLLTIRGRRRRTEAYFLHSQRKICRRRKVAWVLERPQFWFEHMLLNQYAGSLTDLEGSLNGTLFIFAEKKLRRGHRRLARRIKIEPACYISDFKCDLTALSDELTTSCFSLEEIDC